MKPVTLARITLCFALASSSAIVLAQTTDSTEDGPLHEHRQTGNDDGSVYSAVTGQATTGQPQPAPVSNSHSDSVYSNNAGSADTSTEISGVELNDADKVAREDAGITSPAEGSEPNIEGGRPSDAGYAISDRNVPADDFEEAPGSYDVGDAPQETDTNSSSAGKYYDRTGGALSGSVDP